MLAVGGSEKMHRTVLSCVLRGHGPGDAAAEVSMKKMLRTVEAVLDASGTRDNEKRAWGPKTAAGPRREAQTATGRRRERRFGAGWRQSGHGASTGSVSSKGAKAGAPFGSRSPKSGDGASTGSANSHGA